MNIYRPLQFLSIFANLGWKYICFSIIIAEGTYTMRYRGFSGLFLMLYIYIII